MRRISALAPVLVMLVGCHHAKPAPGEDLGAGDLAMMVPITVTPANATVAVTFGATASQTYQALAGSTDVTSSCTFTVGEGAFGAFTGATLAVGQHGGTTTVTASCPQGSGSTNLTVNISGSTVVFGAPAGSAALFSSATVGTDTTMTPSIEYPLDGALAPANFPAIDAQWTTAGNDLFHLNVTATYLALDVYSTSPDVLFDSATWANVLTSAIGDTLKITVEGLQQATPTTRYRSTPVSMQISSDTISNTTLYWWASSQGNLISQNFGSGDTPSVVRGECTACHSLSRAGSRIGYSRCVGNDCTKQYVGFMKSEMGVWTDTMNADDEKQLGSYTTFAPVGNPYPDDTQAIAAVAVSTCNLTLYDPDQGVNVASNLDAVSTHDTTGAATRCATMPDWSADGNTLVFASGGTGTDDVDVQSSVIATMSYSYAAGTSTHTFGEPQPIVSGPLTLSSGTYSNFFFPSFSPDGKYIVFDAAKSAWRNFTDEHTPASRLVLTDPTGAWTYDLAALNGADGDYDITWPHWAPNSSAKYYWVVFSSERDYGHVLTAANTASACVANGNQQCKQIWLGAIDVSKLNGSTPPTIDPSFPPLWLPGQEIDADNISPYWSVPAGIN